MIRSLLLPLFATSALAAGFQVEKMPDPPTVDPQIGGLDVLPDGRLAAVFHRGELQIIDPATKLWTPFAEGLHEPLGLVVESESSMLVMQRAELTRLRDSDGDGLADQYITLWDDFGMSGNYHEFAFGPARGPDGSLYVALNIASNGAGIAPEIRGEWSEIGRLDRQEMVGGAGWGERKGRAGRMYARVPWRGWIMKLSSDGRNAEPFAAGFRSPNGIGFDADGNVLVTDNQGDWLGTSPLHTVEKDGFYGHPASLVWREGWEKDPLEMKVDELEKLRTPASALFPQGELANSPTQPLLIPETWGPYAGQVVIGDMNQKHLVRYIPDEVDGFRQGALLPMMAGTSIGNGNNRLAFGPDGTLWVGKTHLSWAGAEGLVKVTLEDPDSAFIVTGAKLGKGTLTLSFSQPLADDPESPAVKRYRYKYHKAYGSPKIDESGVPVRGMHFGDGGRSLEITLGIEPGFLHELDLSKLRSKDGAPLEGERLYYHAVKVPK